MLKITEPNDFCFSLVIPFIKTISCVFIKISFFNADSLISEMCASESTKYTDFCLVAFEFSVMKSTKPLLSVSWSTLWHSSSALIEKPAQCCFEHSFHLTYRHPIRDESHDHCDCFDPFHHGYRSSGLYHAFVYHEICHFC